MSNHTGKFLTLIILFCSITVKLSAQTPNRGKITGIAIDAATNETIPSASATIYDKKTMARVRTALTDLDGNFVIGDIPNGVYTFKLTYVGYQTMVRDSIRISDNNFEIALAQVKMKVSAGSAITEVTVTAERPAMQLGIDKKVFSVDQSLVSEGGSASDLLQNVPSVQTDIDGNVSLRGSSGVRVLIDGKPSLIAGGNIAQILQSIPASSIESVELITNPSAKYDAEGQGGIINIVLKKNKKLGFNGSVSLTAGNRDNYNGNTNLSFQNSRINLYGNYGYRYGNRPGGGYNNISFFNPAPGDPGFSFQDTESASLDKSHNLKAGLDYYLTDKSVISFTGGFNARENNRSEFLNLNQFNTITTPVNLTGRDSRNRGSGQSYDLGLDYSLKFEKPREELTVNLSFSEGGNDNIQRITSNTYVSNSSPVNGPADIQQIDNDGINRNFNMQADYTLPVGKAGKIEAGVRNQYRKSENSQLAMNLNNANGNYDVFFPLTNEFNSTDRVTAAYFNYQNTINNFGYQVGLRAEDAQLDTRMGVYGPAVNLMYTPGKVAYRRLYPSMFLTQKFAGENQVQLSYSRRVNRPRGWDVNPFQDITDPTNIRQGNPNLQPEDVHAFEISYSKFFKKGNFTSSTYMRRTNDEIQRITFEPTVAGDPALTMPLNVSSSMSYGLELISRIDVSKKWNFTSNVNLYQRNISAVPEYQIAANNGFSWNANLTNNITLPYNITLQIKGDYRSREVTAQGYRRSMYAFDGGAKYDFPDKKASLSLNVRDIFNTRNWTTVTYGNNNTSLRDNRRFQLGTQVNLTFSYRFGKSVFEMKKNRKPDQQEGRPDEESF